MLAFDQFDAMNGPVAALTYDLNQAFGAEVASGLSMQGSRLVVTAAHQVHIFDSAPDSQSDRPDVSIGDPINGCSSTRLRQPKSAVLTPLGQLVVADTFNHRVLIWSTVPEAGTVVPADIVLGQRSMIRCVENDDDGNGTVDTASNGTMFFPVSVWSDGVRLLVADNRNHRILVWDSFPTAADPDSQRASRVLGQETFRDTRPNRGGSASATSLAFPSSVDVSQAGELAVADYGNNRVLIWPSIPDNFQPAGFVVGQSDFTHRSANDVDQRGETGTVPSAATLSSPSGARFHGRNLIVNDTGNDRVLVWRE